MQVKKLFDGFPAAFRDTIEELFRFICVAVHHALQGLNCKATVGWTIFSKYFHTGKFPWERA